MDLRTAVGVGAVGLLVVGTATWVTGMPGPDPVVAAVAAPAPTRPGVDDAGRASLTDHVVADGRAAASVTDGVVDPGWLSDVSRATGVPRRALQAYAAAAVGVAGTDPGCGLSWNTLAAIGAVESGHGGAGADPGGAGAGGQADGIVGPALDGDGVAAIRDTDGGALDGDATWDRAVGPMQFIPSSWAVWGVDGSGDGVADPADLDDAALAAAHYLCAAGADLTTGDGWTAAVRAYNHSDAYVAAVRDRADRYAETAGR